MHRHPDEGVAVTGMPVGVEPKNLHLRAHQIGDVQDLALGVVGGAVAAAIGAAVWATISYLTNYQIGWMAVGVGFMVGFAVRFLGKGVDAVFGIVGAALSLAGCLAGNLLTVCLVVARQEEYPLLDLLSRLNADLVVKLMSASFRPMDLLFYGLAIYEGYRFSFRPMTGEEGAATAS